MRIPNTVLFTGDISLLSEAEKEFRYNTLCARFKLRPSSMPFKIYRIAGRQYIGCSKQMATLIIDQYQKETQMDKPVLFTDDLTFYSEKEKQLKYKTICEQLGINPADQVLKLCNYNSGEYITCEQSVAEKLIRKFLKQEKATKTNQ